jgi:hypothetical protein
MVPGSMSIISLVASKDFRFMYHLVHRPLIALFYQPRMIDDDECGAVGGMRIGRENRSTRRKPALVTLCPPQIRRDLAWARTLAAAVGNRRLTGHRKSYQMFIFLTAGAPPCFWAFNMIDRVLG